jgi:hypothetical protein
VDEGIADPACPRSDELGMLERLDGEGRSVESKAVDCVVGGVVGEDGGKNRLRRVWWREDERMGVF